MPHIIKNTEFATKFEELYLGRGFGSMNKNELEVLFFYLLKEYGDIKGKSVFQLARDLHVPEAKVKRLAYESELSYGDTDHKTMQERFLGLLADAKVQKENGTLRFVVEDKYLRSTIYEDLKRQGYYLDSSFNSEIVSIQKDALIALLDSYYQDEDKQKIVDQYKKARKEVRKADGDAVSFKGVMSVIFNKLLETGADKAAEGLADVGYDSIIRTISQGAKAVTNIVNIIAKIAILF